MCVSPRLLFTRRVSIKLFKNGEKYASHSRFYSCELYSQVLSIQPGIKNYLFMTQGTSLMNLQNTQFIYQNDNLYSISFCCVISVPLCFTEGIIINCENGVK